MNFKPVVASLFALGLISTPVLAAKEAKEQTKHHKHHERHVVHHHHHQGVRAEHGVNAAQDYFISTNSARSPVAALEWVNRFHLSGMINVDGKYSTRAPLGSAPGFRIHDEASDINVNNANLFVDVDVNRWVSGHIGVAYVSDSVNVIDWDVNTNFAGTAFSDSVRADKGAVFSNGRLSVDEAYITIRDFSQSPFFLRAGKMYVPFGDNPDTYPITYSFTQLLSQTRGTAAQVGWIGNHGVYGSAYLLAGAESSFELAHRGTAIVFDGALGAPEDYAQSYTEVNNWGAQLGYCGGYDDVRFHLSASYLKDERDVWYLAAINDLVKYSFIRNDGRGGMGYRFHQVGGGALHGDLTYGPLFISANYVSALGNLLSEGRRERQEDRRHHDDDSRIAAGDITGTFNSNVWGYNTAFTLGYQRSWDASPVLPEWRLLGSIGACILPYTTLTLQYTYDRDYDRDDHVLDHFISDHDRQENEGHHHRHHSDERSSGTAALRLGVVF